MFYSKVGNSYVLKRRIYYYSERYGKSVLVPEGYTSDGATGAFDIESESWWVHDLLCDIGRWADGTKVTNWQASRVLSDILWDEGRQVRSGVWLVATFLFGGGKARANGMVKLKNKVKK